jgi:hypothetical protein
MHTIKCKQKIKKRIDKESYRHGLCTDADCTLIVLLDLLDHGSALADEAADVRGGQQHVNRRGKPRVVLEQFGNDRAQGKGHLAP